MAVAGSPCSSRYEPAGNQSTLTKSAAYPSSDASRENTVSARTNSCVPL